RPCSPPNSPRNTFASWVVWNGKTDESRHLLLGLVTATVLLGLYHLVSGPTIDRSLKVHHLLWRQLDVLEVGEIARNHAREHILRDVLGVHGGLSEQPEHGYLSEFGELMVAYLPQQARPLRRLHHRA